MRVAFVTNNYTPYSGGVVQSIDAITHTLQQRGHVVHIFALDFLGTKHDDAPWITRLLCPVKFTFQEKHIAVPWQPGTQMHDALTSFAPDIIHVHHPFLLGPLALKTARSMHIPVLFTYHTLYEQYAHHIPLPKMLCKPVIKKLALDFCAQVDHIIAPSSAIAHDLLSANITTPISVIPSPIRDIFFEHGDKTRNNNQESLVHQYKAMQRSHCERSVAIQTQNTHSSWIAAPHTGARDDDSHSNSSYSSQKTTTHILNLNVLFVSRFAPEKNVSFIIEAINHLRDTPHITFDLVGYGPEFESTKTHVCKTLQLSPEQVRFTHKPPLETLVRMYRDANLFLFASTTDTQGLVLAEAMATGTPVICTHGPGQSDIVVEGHNGFFVQTPAHMAEVILNVQHDRTLHEQLIHAAHETAQRYRAQHIGKSIEQVYRKIRTPKVKKI